MKTNVTLTSKDRNLFGVTIRQDTKDDFLSVTDLQDAYSHARIEFGWKERRVERILSTNDAAERIYYILKEQNMIKAPFCAFMEDVYNQSLVKVLKKYKAYKTKGARENKYTSCNKYIWILLAMEMNPALYAKVVMWVGDSLITNRIEAGDKYNELCRAASKFKNVDYKSIAKGINYIIFNVHETLIRNSATSNELRELDDLQKSLAFAIDMNYIKSFDELINEMRKLWYNKWDKK